MTNKKLTVVNFTIVSYFLLIWLLIIFKVENDFIGAFIELLTIPFLVAQLLFLILGIKYLLKKKRESLTVFSIILLAVCAIIIVGSFL